MSTDERELPDPGSRKEHDGNHSSNNSENSEEKTESLGVESTKNLLLTFVFDLANQHVRKYQQLDSENLARDIGLSAFEQLWRQPTAREKIFDSLRNGTDYWKRVAHLCVIHARAEKLRLALQQRHRQSGLSSNEVHLQASIDARGQEWREEVQRCIGLLDKDRQTVIRLRFDHGLTFQEIAMKLNWSKTRVHGCYTTALQHIEQALKARM